jgi:hypothetical protein
VLAAHEVRLPSPLDHGAEELAGDVMRKQPLAVLLERRRVQRRLGDVHVEELAEPQVVYSSCSQNWRSRCTQESTIRSKAFRSRSGGIDGRPVRALVASKIGDIGTKQFC